MQVLKFGGTSVADEKSLRLVAKIIREATEKDRTIIVVSALGGVTDLLLKSGMKASEGDPGYRQLLEQFRHRHLTLVNDLLENNGVESLVSTVKELCKEVDDICNGIFLLKEFSPRSHARVAAYGELLSSKIISGWLEATGSKNTWTDSRSLIITDDQFTKAQVDKIKTYQNISGHFSGNISRLFVLPGFIAASTKGETTTLGRGGSDYTAALLGAALDADLVQIWTDVPGMMSADPRLVPLARTIETISFQEAMELSHFGAKVLYPPSIQPLMQKDLSVWIKNTFDPQAHGTLIKGSAEDNSIIRGISSMSNIALISLEGSGMIGIPGFSRRLFEALSRQSINVILITQASSEHTICVGIEDAMVHHARIAVDQEFRTEIKEGKLNPLETEHELAIVALVGDHMKNHTGISGKMFSALGRNGINIRAIAQGSSERNISTVVNSTDVRKAINVLHEEFFEPPYRQVNLFIAGAGNVGTKLLTQLRQQQDYLRQHLRLQLRVIGMCNSRKMVISETGLDLANWEGYIQNGQPLVLKDFIESIEKKNLRNSVFIDVTASTDVAALYGELFQKSISVVACNKVACSSAYKVYRELKDLAAEFNAQFLFETNVGAGLPVINTLNDLVSSGDRIFKIEAVLSGTLNFVFNHYNGERSFAEIVRQAQDEGFTEPDPRLDLSGTDVMRKILILAREAGEVLEMEDINNNSFLPPSCMEGSVDDFYRELLEHEEHFRKLYEEANREGSKLKYVAMFENGKASVGLKRVEASHDFFHLYGKDNVVRFYTQRYTDQPLVVKGAGAGADVTASGVFADIIKTARI